MTLISYPPSDHYDGSHFKNTDPQASSAKGFFDVMKWKATSRASPWPDTVQNTANPNVFAAVEVGQARITCVNHATQLIQMHKFTVLTDPIYADRASPVQWAGPKRVRVPGVLLAQLPHIDVVVVSHNHYDHLDMTALVDLHKRHHPLFVVPLGNASLLTEAGITQVVELDWWQRHIINARAAVTLTEAQHWSARGVFDRNKALWGGFVMEAGGVKVFFAGDTAYSAHFKRVVEHTGAPDVALLPIGAYEPRWFMRAAHMNPSDAVQAYADLQAKIAIGMHFGTFQLTDEGIDAPEQQLAMALKEARVSSEVFLPLQNGASATFPLSRGRR